MMTAHPKTRDFDRALVLSETELKHLPTGYLTAYREMGWRTLRAGRTETAIRSFHAAAAASPQDVRTLVGRSQARTRKNLFREAQADAEKVLENNEFDKEAIFVQAHCQYELGNVEEGLVMFHRGINKRGARKEFREGCQAVEATLENCVGRHAGPVLTHLQTHVRKMADKQRHSPKLGPHHMKKNCLAELDKQPTHHCSPEEWRRLDRRKADRERKIARVYLGRLADDHEWWHALANSESLKTSQQATDINVREIAQKAVQELDNQLKILQERKPLYHFKHKVKGSEVLYRQKSERLIDIKQKIKKQQTEKMMTQLKQSRTEMRTCVMRAHRIKAMLDTFSPPIHFLKLEYLKDLCETVGQAYLDRKTFRTHLTEAENRLRVSCWLGLNKEYNDMKMDPITQSSDFPFFDHDSWRKTYKGYLAVSENDLERAWLHYEVARTYVVTKKWQHLVAEANKAAANARQCGSLEWEINALFLAAVGESQRRDGGEALEILDKGQALALKLRNESVVELIRAAKVALAGREEESLSLDTAAIVRRREDEIVRLQGDLASKERVRDLLARIRALPANRRLGLVPGIAIRTKDEKTAKSTNKSIIPGGSGGRLGLHPVTSKTYYEFLEVNAKPAN